MNSKGEPSIRLFISASSNSIRNRFLQLSMKWDDDLSHLLMPALVSYENEQLLGVASGQEEFQQSIKVTVPVGHTFKVSASG